jgi:two-component system chemotaxis sensor kinase CheA
VPLDLQRYLTLFVAEAGDHLDALSRDLVQLEQLVRGDAPWHEVKPVIDSLFRHAHSVKGMSASMQLDGISGLAHKAEDLVDVFRTEAARVDAAAIDALLAAGDALAEMVDGASRGERQEADPALMARLSEATRRARDGRPAEPPAAAPPEAGAPGVPPGRPTGEAPPAAQPTAAEATPARAPDAAPEEPAARPEPAAAVPLTSRHVLVEVEISASCPVPAVRGFLVVKKLSSLGAVVRTTPTVDELKAGRIPGKQLTVHLETAEPFDRLQRALSQISDLGPVGLREAEEPAPAPAAAAPATSPTGAPAAEPSRTVRVRTEILDGFVDAVGELLLATARIREVGRALPAAHRPPLEEGVDRLHAIVKELHDKVMAVRMTPLATITERLPRAARDVARRLGRQVEVEIRGAEIELDRAILEELSDPLLHVLRNAVDHGIEPPHLRLLAGKPATGHITVTARRDRDRVILELADDGKGMDPARLREAAVTRGSLSANEAAALSDREALLLACLPGISTAEQVTDVSGRGVGLDAVKRTVEAVGGTLEISSAPGEGSRILLRLPLTVAVQPVLLVGVGEEVLGLPIAKVHGAAQVSFGGLDRSQGGPILPYDGELVPVRDLAELLGFPPDGRDDRAVVVAEVGDGRIGLAVDALLGQQEAVLKPLGAPLGAVAGLSAVTVLGNGRPVFILDVPRLLVP